MLRGHAELLEVVDGAPVDVVVNRLRAGAIGADAGAQVRSTIRRFSGIDTVHLVPDDQRGFDSAVLAGRTLPDAAPRSIATRA
ncbi:hypothetical protein ACC691_38055, partial [Rhizobium johnstonii]|uniref:hypothetical protein n=1 Tax=Rhizobium johnstonii TaxID=3019933 RepID=UPI003F9A5BAF